MRLVVMIVALMIWVKLSLLAAHAIVDGYGLIGTVVACACLYGVSLLWDRQRLGPT